jgi:cyclopropane fatty-acyl-phospholipid synthase-like methyltransferase
VNPLGGLRLVGPASSFLGLGVGALIEVALGLATTPMDLTAGDRVLDVGCGPGGSFPYLVHAVGQSGQVIGVEISPEMSINAKRRIAKNGWRNVQVIEAAAEDVHLTGLFDALLMFAAPDV